jgi:heat shock protein HslJ
MKSLLLLLNLTIFAAASCQKEPSIEIANDTEIWWINSAKVDCQGVGHMSCLQIQKGEHIDNGAWELFYSEIEGFTYEPGNLYQVKVEISKKSEPIPADASSLNFKLVEIMSKEPDLSLRLTNIWKVLEVGEFKDPKSFKTGEALIFEINRSAGTYFGDMGCNSVRGGIKEADAENLLLGPGASTMMACPDMKLEQAIGKALIDTRKYKLENNQLHLLDSAGNALIKFQAVD